MTELPKPIRFTISEGGPWIDWTWESRRSLNGPPAGVVAHAVMFDNGRVFDMLNGWRSFRYCTHCGCRVFDGDNT